MALIFKFNLIFPRILLICAFSEMDPLKDLGSLAKKKGQTVCHGCPTVYNNRVLPQNCGNCSAYLGGKYEAKEKVMDAKMITADIASVRLNQAGIPIRVFVDLKDKRCV